MFSSFPCFHCFHGCPELTESLQCIVGKNILVLWDLKQESEKMLVL